MQFTNDGDSVFSPVGNRISQFDLKRYVLSFTHEPRACVVTWFVCRNKSWTYPFENRKNISRFAVSPNGLLMISVDEGTMCHNAPTNSIVLIICFLINSGMIQVIFHVLFTVDGRSLLVNLHRKVVLHHFNFKQPVLDIKFSPNGK